MPLGTVHVETGVLLHDGDWLTLQRDDGGRWRLLAPRRSGRLLGQRVTVEGTRSGFDLLDVKRIGRP